MPTWALVTLIAWPPVAAAIAVVVGRSVKLADQRTGPGVKVADLTLEIRKDRPGAPRVGRWT